MSTLQLVSNPRLVDDELDLHDLTVTANAIRLDTRDREAIRVSRDPLLAAIVVDVPQAGSFQLRIKGFSLAGAAYTVTASSRLDAGHELTWTTDGADAVSPPFTATGRYVVSVVASTAGAPSRRATVPIRLDKPGKPGGDLLEQFPQE
jgi:hypothetical protein